MFTPDTEYEIKQLKKRTGFEISKKVHAVHGLNLSQELMLKGQNDFFLIHKLRPVHQ